MASGKTTNKPAALKGGSFIQIFLDDEDKHFIDAVRETTYNEMLLNGGRRHSEFMQPYLSPDYPGMDYLWPDTGFFGDVPGANDALIEKTGGGGAGGAYHFQCIISCEPTISDSKCDSYEPLKCYYGAITGDGFIDNWYMASPDTPADFHYVTFKKGSGAAPVHVFPSTYWSGMSSEGGGQYWITVGYTDVGTGRDEWYYHPLMQKWIYILAGRSTCHYDVYVNCLQCPPDVSLAFDDASTPDTMDPGDHIDLYIVDGSGLAPYTWSTTSMGYTLDDAETYTNQNGLSCVNGAGVCGTDFDPYATITVTDSCEESVTFYIRNTDGKWTYIGGKNVTGTGGCVCLFNPKTCWSYLGLPTGAGNKDIIGYEAWSFPGGDCSRDPSIYGDSPCSPTWVVASGSPVDPACGSPLGCGDASNCGCGTWCWVGYDYWNWTC